MVRTLCFNTSSGTDVLMCFKTETRLKCASVVRCCYISLGNAITLIEMTDILTLGLVSTTYINVALGFVLNT